LKVTYGNDIRRISLTDVSFQTLEQTLYKLFQIPQNQQIDVQYKDDEGDLVTISSDTELEEAFSVVRTMHPNAPTLRLFLSQKRRPETTPTPQEPLHRPWHHFVDAHECPFVQMGDWYQLHREAMRLFESESKEDMEKARALLLEQSALNPSHKVPLYNLACAEARLQNLDSALSYLQKSINAGYTNVEHMEVDSDLDSLRHLPAFQAILTSLRQQPSTCPALNGGWGRRWGRRCGRGMHKWRILQQKIDRLFESGSRDDLEVARVLLLKQYAMKPSSSVSIYNLACVEALLGNSQDALGYLSKAILAGWNDVEHMEKDTDLDSLRELEEYKALVASIKEQRSAHEPVQQQDYFTVQSQPIQPESIPVQHPQTETVQQLSISVPIPVQPEPVPVTVPVQQPQGIFEAELDVLSAMGFPDVDKNRTALKRASGNLNAAVEFLLHTANYY